MHRALLLLLLVPAAAMAQPVANPDDPQAFAQLVMSALSASNWNALAALAVVGIVWLVRNLGGKKWPVLRTKKVSASLGVLVSVAGAIATAILAPGAAVSLSLILKAAMVGLTAAGGWTVVKIFLEEDSSADVLARAHSAGVSQGEAASPRAPTALDIANKGKLPALLVLAAALALSAPALAAPVPLGDVTTATGNAACVQLKPSRRVFAVCTQASLVRYKASNDATTLTRTGAQAAIPVGADLVYQDFTSATHVWGCATAQTTAGTCSFFEDVR